MLKDSRMCDKAVNRYFFVFGSIPDPFKDEKCVTELFLKIFFSSVYCPDKYKTQNMCDEAVDDCLTTLKFIPDWFVTSKMIKKFLTA